MKNVFIILVILLMFFVFACDSGEKAVSAGASGQDEFAVDDRYVQEIEAIAGNAKVKNAFRYIEETEEQSIRDLIMLNEIAAPPFKEEKRAQKYAEMLRKAGADDVRIDKVGNVIARRRGAGSGKTVAIDGHLDTVFPEGTDVTVKMHGDTLYAPGISDDTRALILNLYLLKAMNKAGIRTEADILIIGTVGEEGLGDLRGVKHLFSDEGPGIDSWISVDGGGIGRIVNAGVGSHRYRVTFKGPGGHSLGAFGLVNPHHALGTAISYFVEGADPYTAQGPRTTYNVGMIGGGTSINSIPFESWMEVDMRSNSPERLAGVDEIFQNAIKKALKEQNEIKRRGPELTVDVKMVGDRPSGKHDHDVPLIQRAAASAKFFGAEPSLGSSSTNSNTPIALGVPAITIGRGGAGGGVHSLNEWWLNKDGNKAVFNALVILLAEAGIVE